MEASSTTQTITKLEEGNQEADMVHFDVRPRQRIQWGEDVIDNEHMNKKKSKSKEIIISEF